MLRPTVRLAASLLLAAFVATASAGVVVVQEADQTGGPMPGKTRLTMTLEGERARMDMGESLSSIVDFQAGTITTLLHAQRMAMPLPKAMLDAARAAAAQSSQKPNLKPTGRTETISGYPCEEYTGTFQGLDLTYWVTKQSVPAQATLLKQMSQLSGGADPLKAAMADGSDFPGFPIRTIVKSKEMGSSTMTVLSIKEQKVPDSTFRIPSGYQTMSAPKVPGMGQ